MNDLLTIYKKQKVLITGHTGFKGSWLSLWLTKLGAKVIGYSLDPPTKPNFFEAINIKNRITHIKGDIRNEKYLLAIFKKYQPSFIFHLAAQPLVRVSYKKPKLTYETNVMGTVNVLEAVRNVQSVRVCIIVTSDKCYENKERLYGYKETDPLGGYDTYSSSKACAELVVNAYRRSFLNPETFNKKYATALSSVRAGNVIGGGDWGNDRIIPDSIKSLSEGRIIKIRNPGAIRPWQYVLESLSGYLLLGALMYKDGKCYSDAWNFGPNNEKNITVEELVKHVIKYWGKGKYSIDVGTHPHEASFLKLDISKACSLLYWMPVYDIHEAIKRTTNWYKKFYLNKSDPKNLLIYSLQEITEYSQRFKYARYNEKYPKN